MPLGQTRTRPQHTPAAAPLALLAQEVGGSHLFSMREMVLMMELMMTHTVKRSTAMPGLAVRPLPLTYGNRPACPDACRGLPRRLQVLPQPPHSSLADSGGSEKGGGMEQPELGTRVSTPALPPVFTILPSERAAPSAGDTGA